MGATVGKLGSLSGVPRPKHAAVLRTVWNDVMAEVQELPTNDLSGDVPARGIPLCMEA